MKYHYSQLLLKKVKLSEVLNTLEAHASEEYDIVHIGDVSQDECLLVFRILLQEPTFKD
jgi:hypothetical protein